MQDSRNVVRVISLKAALRAQIDRPYPGKCAPDPRDADGRNATVHLVDVQQQELIFLAARESRPDAARRSVCRATHSVPRRASAGRQALGRADREASGTQGRPPAPRKRLRRRTARSRAGNRDRAAVARRMIGWLATIRKCLVHSLVGVGKRRALARPRAHALSDHAWSG